MYLALAAGAADASGRWRLGQVFCSAMTANTALLGIALAQGHLAHATRSLVAPAGFVAGAAAGSLLLDRAHRRDRRWPVLTLVEAGILTGFALLWWLDHQPVSLLILLLAGAIGLQSETARHLGVPGVMTTFSPARSRCWWRA